MAVGDRPGDGPPGGDIMWAPWRMPYLKAEHGGGDAAEGCVFCALVARGDDEAALILLRGERAFIVMNLFPYTNGHLMVVPYQHTSSLLELPAETLTEIMRLAQRAQAALERAMRPQGFNLGVNQGRAAGAGIADHVHLHLLPRWVGDTNFLPAIGHTRVMPQHIGETYTLLRGELEA